MVEMDILWWKWIYIYTWFTWYPSAGSYEQTLQMVLPGTKLKTYPAFP